MSYDLGVRGDYKGLYTWLDRHEAQECGDSTASFFYEYKNVLKDELKADLSKAVELRTSARVYIVYFDNSKEKTTGAFVLGGRKAAPWSGYGGQGQEMDVDEEV